jgi:predicted glutamine amidotransferase
VCGLVGMMGDFTFRHRAVMKTMMFFNTLRGRDSTGLCVFKRVKREIDTRKLTIPGYEFVQMPWMDNMLCLDAGVWMAHGRARTVGEVTRLNAHPFEVIDDEGYISHIGAHNGTLSNKYDVEKASGGQFGTDSEALINLIAKEGPKDAISKASGAWALTWVATAENKLYMLRNKERPLYYAYTEDRKALIWASEIWMIRIACLREDVKLETHENSVDPAVYAVPEDTLLAWNIPKFDYKDAPEKRLVGQPEREGGLLGAPEKKYFPQGGRIRGALEEWFLGDPEEPDPNVPEAEKKSGETGKEGKEKAGKLSTVSGFEGEQVSKEFVEEMKKHGCDWCAGPITNNAFGWLDDMSIACSHCLRGDHFKIDLKEGTIIEEVKQIVQQK